MENRTIVVVVNGKRKEFEIECEKDVVIDDCSFELKKKKVKEDNVLYITGKKIKEEGCYDERHKIATNVTMVAINAAQDIAYVTEDETLHLYHKDHAKQLKRNVKQIKFTTNGLYYLTTSGLLFRRGNNALHEFLGKDIDTFSCCSGSIIYVKQGVLYGFGDGAQGLLGDYNTSEHEVTIPVIIAYNVKSVSIHMQHLLFITNDKQLYGLGSNSHMQLKNDTQKRYLSPVFIADNVVNCFAGHSVTLYNTPTGLVGCGDGVLNVMNDQNKAIHNVYKRIVTHNMCKKVKISNNFNVFNIDGSLWCIGGVYHNKDLKLTTSHINAKPTILSEAGEIVGDFDVSLYNVAFIVE